MKNDNIKVIFLDRDGVINKEIGYLYKIKDFSFINGVFKVCNYLQSVGYNLIIITNQSGIARGYYKEDDFYRLNKWMLKQFTNHGIKILDIFFCPHHPNVECNCRKPKPGLLLDANKKYRIDMKNSWMIGDKEVDIMAANAANIMNTILVRSGHKVNEANSNAKYFLLH